ncbi:hypothetical protein Tco_0653997 [Tanacetum coccineum]|uniref:Uncharacterized protein n=1 Tax=Tanacetum coccineum TaxID=301880 RepID=A0ABQ4X2E5_9ASTR
MSTQQDIYAAGSENRPPMLNKENYVPWSSRLLRYAKSRPNGKLIYNSIMNGPYVRRMIPEPGDADREVPVSMKYHSSWSSEDTYAAVDSFVNCSGNLVTCANKMLKGTDNGIQEMKLSFLMRRERAFKLNYSTPTKTTKNFHQPSYIEQIAQPGSEHGQRQTDVDVGAMELFQDVVQNQGVQNDGNQNGKMLFQELLNRIPMRWNVGTVQSTKKRRQLIFHDSLLIAQKEEAGIQLQAEEFD